MHPLDWAKERFQTYQQIAEQRAQAQDRRKKDELDANELHKLIVTLRQRGHAELGRVAGDLAAVDHNGRATNPFARRSKKYAQAFADLCQYVVGQLPQDQQEAHRSMRWLERLLKIEDTNRALLSWLLRDG